MNIRKVAIYVGVRDANETKEQTVERVREALLSLDDVGVGSVDDVPLLSNPPYSPAFSPSLLSLPERIGV